MVPQNDYERELARELECMLMPPNTAHLQAAPSIRKDCLWKGIWFIATYMAKPYGPLSGAYLVDRVVCEVRREHGPCAAAAGLSAEEE